ncbi:hypothetical protein DS2_16194 [Catenovulum agarivorans DS-2]|uniref:Fe-S protein n=1 Tax=Catenovulum agarivorans DS-2 TaxID=1328313 RepID=W7Q7G1_9ALTE|nr:DUF1289 domain-containing protein [Catenovulum agarivorans]EWH08709.1 hypothetical protein DS2_16194 [Catenovulum agarivorans DS-2]
MRSIKQESSVQVQSPCVRNCCLDSVDICIGCGRSIDEITGWTQMTAQQKRQTIEVAKQRLNNLTNNLV